MLAEFLNVFGLRNPRNWQFAIFEPTNVAVVVLGSDQFVVTAADKVEQVVQELGDVSRAHEIVQSQFAEILAQKNPQLFVVQDAEVATTSNQ
jgi:hypothetical protein